MRQETVAAESGLSLTNDATAVGPHKPSAGRARTIPWPRGRARWLTLAGTIALVGLVLGAAMWRDRGASVATFTCDGPSFDFGKVSPETAASLHHDFRLTNRTGRPIRIVGHRASCGCTTAVPPSAAVAPGEAIIVPVTVNWGSRDGNESSEVVLTTESGGTTSKLTLKTSAFVDNPVLIIPRALEFGDVPPGPSPEQFIEVRRIEPGSLLYVTAITATDPRIKIRRAGGGDHAQQPLEGDAGRFAVSFDSPDESETCRAVIRISTSAAPPMMVTVHAHATSAIRVSPTSVLFDCRDGDDHARHVTVAVSIDTAYDRNDSLEATTKLEGRASPAKIASISRDNAANRRSAVIDLTCDPSAIGITSDELRLTFGRHATTVPITVLGATN